MHTHIHVHTYAHISIYIYKLTHMHKYTETYTYKHALIYTGTHANAYKHTSTDAHINSKHTHTHTLLSESFLIGPEFLLSLWNLSRTIYLRLTSPVQPAPEKWNLHNGALPSKQTALRLQLRSGKSPN